MINVAYEFYKTIEIIIKILDKILISTQKN